MTDQVDVFEAGEDEVLQQLAADPSRSHHQHLASGEGVRELFTKGTNQLNHVDRLETEPEPTAPIASSSTELKSRLLPG